MKLKYLPNLITSLRIVGTASLLFIEPFTAPFFVIYTLTGLTDILDGWVARTFKLTSKFGARLDSIADLMFYAVMLIRIFPVMWEVLPVGIWVTVGFIVISRLLSYIYVAVKFRCFASLHTYMNKISGGSVFIIPYIIETPMATFVCSLICAITGVASIEEWIINIRMKKYNTKVKTVMSKELYQGV